MKEELKKRTLKFGLEAISLIESLPSKATADVIGRQLLRSATSVGANYRAACRAKSTADFISKMGTVEEEADESMYWLEVLAEKKMGDQSTILTLTKEADELLRIVVSSIKTARQR